MSRKLLSFHSTPPHAIIIYLRNPMYETLPYKNMFNENSFFVFI